MANSKKTRFLGKESKIPNKPDDFILDYVKNHLLDVFAYNCFRDELKYFFESEKSDKTFKTLDGEEVSIYDKFNHFDFEGLINMDLRFSDEEVKS